MSSINLKVVANFLSALGTAAANPIFSGAGLAVSSALKLGASLIESGEQGIEGLKALTAQVEGMVADGREPTVAEWKDLRSRSDAAHARIQATAPAPTPPVDGGDGASKAVPQSVVPDTRGKGQPVPAIGSRQPTTLASEHRTTPTTPANPTATAARAPSSVAAPSTGAPASAPAAAPAADNRPASETAPIKDVSPEGPKTTTVKTDEAKS